VTRIELVPAEAALPVFDRARARYGWLPRTIQVMAQGSGAAELYLTAGESNARSVVPDLVRELIAIGVAARHGCRYCLSAHALSAHALGVSADEVVAARSAQSNDPTIEPILRFAADLLRTCGRLDEDTFRAYRSSGLDDQTMLDVAAIVAENMLGNFVNNLAMTKVDTGIQRRLARLELDGVLA
jgi:AhpD family alkylhydroperoxidase